jgi:hypothetical protein
LEPAWLCSPGGIEWLAGEADLDAQAAFGAGMGGDCGAVGVGDCGDDGQAEPVPVTIAGGGRGQALEGPEQPLENAMTP